MREIVPLPEFESWADEYRRPPERFEPMLLGLWQDAMESGDDDPEAEGE